MIMYEDKGFKFDRGEGSWLYSGSNKYLDLCAGTFNVLVGWGNKEISDKVVSVLNNGITIDTTHVYNQYAEIASKKLLSLSSNMNRVHFKGCPDGSLAVEQAIKHAFATNKNGGAILSLTHSHHGQSIFISNISGLKLERTFTPKLNLPHSFLDLSKYLHNPNCYFNISPSDKDSILKEIFSDIANYADLHARPLNSVSHTKKPLQSQRFNVC
jgi:4-aminobutyrate aminotransferase-like enzyme